MTVMDPVAFASFGKTIIPMLAAPPKPGVKITDLRDWIFDIKLDGVRTLAFWDGAGLTLRNRSGRDVTHRYPDLCAAFECLGPDPVILDGEIVAQSGSFQDTAKRDKQTKPADVAAAMRQVPVFFIAFDVLYVDGMDTRHLPYRDRRQLLEQVPITGILQSSVVSRDPGFFDTVKEMGMEGVIAKHPRSQYRGGRFSDWTKFKALRSITAIGVGYEPGEGARAHFGAMFLVLLDSANQPVKIGRVGTGMKGAEIDYLKKELDEGRPVVCEIECLNKSKDGQLRFPVYKGLRTDLSVTDATMDQLDQIPTM
jgi:bifunctional non-homologous end joining protein LigD